jgi:RNA polymerase sigma-70 factor (ECF subfamily)
VEQDTQAIRETQMNDEIASALIKKIGEGDRSALTSLYDRTNRLIFGIVARVLGDKTSAEEVLLDVYTRIWSKAGSYDSQLLTPLEWLITVARNYAIAMLHWSKQDKRKRKSPTGSMESTITVAQEQQKIARSSIAALVPAQQEILEWAYYSGLSCNEIAAQIGKPLGAVKTHARLGLCKLDSLFHPLTEQEPKPQ